MRSRSNGNKASRRRTVIQSLGAIGIVGLAGCAGILDGDPSDDNGDRDDEDHDNGDDSDVVRSTDFLISNLDPEDLAIEVGDVITVTADVENPGSDPNLEILELRIGETTMEEVSLHLAGGEDTTITFADVEVSEFDEGEYEFGIYGQVNAATGTITITDPYGPLAAPTGDEWESSWVSYDDGWLSYEADDEGNRIPDFGWIGYRWGHEPIPDVPTVETIAPSDGESDDHDRLLAAIESVATYLEDEGESHGALALEPGEYRIEEPLHVNASGVVLRGAGEGEDPAENSIIVADFPEERPAVILGGEENWSISDGNPGQTVDITTEVVSVGSRTFEVADPSPFAEGDDVYLNHPCTEAWLEAIDGGGTAGDPSWDVGEQDIRLIRQITGIDGNEITIDAPVYNHLDRNLSQSTLSTLDLGAFNREAGVENLRISIVGSGERYESAEDMPHNALRFTAVQDAWAQDVTVTNFIRSGIETTRAIRVSVVDCTAIEPWAPIEPPWLYNFSCEAHSHMILYTGCHAEGGRHCYISNGTSEATGLVFHNCVAEEMAGRCEPGHRRWTQGVLFDQYLSISNHPNGSATGLHVGNRGDWGTAHGWGAVHSVAWNCVMHDDSHNGFIIEDPPTANNYAIGCRGPLTDSGSGPFGEAQGIVEGHNNEGVWPPSLYEAQREINIEQYGRVETLNR